MKWGRTSMYSRTGVAGLLPLRHLGSTHRAAETYDAMAQAALAEMNPLSSQKRDFARLFYANAMSMELDGAGRIMLPTRFMEQVKIKSRDVIVAGAGDCLEIWDRERWETYDADLAQRAPDLTASLGHPA